MPLEQLLKDTQEKAKKHEDDLELLKKEYNRFKLLLGQMQQGRACQTQNATTFEIISDLSEIISDFLQQKQIAPTAKQKLSNKYSNIDIDWEKAYTLAFHCTLDTKF